MTPQTISRPRTLSPAPAHRFPEPQSGHRVTTRRCRIVVCIVSSRGLVNLLQLLPAIRPSFPAPILIVPDRFTSFPDSLRFVLEEHSLLHVKPVVHGEVVSPGSIYLAPAEFAVTIDADQKFSVSPRYSGMFDATDRLLASAARTYGRAVAALVLTSTSITGSEGIRQLREIGGLVLTADDFVIETPVADCEKCVVDYWLPGETIPPVLESLVVERASRRE